MRLGFVVGPGYLALQFPPAALAVAGAMTVVVAIFATVIIGTVRRWFGHERRVATA